MLIKDPKKMFFKYKFVFGILSKVEVPRKVSGVH